PGRGESERLEEPPSGAGRGRDLACGCTRGASWAQLRARREVELRAPHSQSASNSRSKVCVKYAGPMELLNDALVTPCEGRSRRRLSPLRLSANPGMLRTA